MKLRFFFSLFWGGGGGVSFGLSVSALWAAGEGPPPKKLSGIYWKFVGNCPIYAPFSHEIRSADFSGNLSEVIG